MAVKVNIGPLQGFSTTEDEVFRTAGRLLEQAINHPTFEERVLKAKYDHLSFKPHGQDPVQKTPADVVAIIRAGLERGSGPDGEIDITIKKDPTIPQGTFGRAAPGVLPFKTAAWFIRDCARGDRPDTISPARHMIHEWLHVAGFVHKAQKGDDPPYVVGSIVRSILKAEAFVGATEDTEVAAALEASFDEVTDEPVT